MLCDDILSDAKLARQYPGFTDVQRRISTANKYVLAADFASAADGLTNNTRELQRIAPFCRLPAPACWFELAQSDRPHFMAAPMHYAALQGAPKRVGFLCFVEDHAKPWEFIAVMCWSMRYPRPEISCGPNNTSSITIWFNTRDGFRGQYGIETYADDHLSNYVQVCLAPFAPPDVARLIRAHDNEFAKLMQSDWGGEIRYLFAVLGLLNARNVMETEAVDRSHNKARERNGKPPLCSHTILKIRAMHRRSLVGARGQGTSDNVREHFCSGHWKNRKTGLFWWNPHWRGNPDRGHIDHDYEVTT